MPEAVIVSAARSPIGRAFKGSLKDVRPDDLAATIVRAALAQVPELDPREIDDLMLGCGLPGGEQGHNLGRVVAVQLGMDHLPGSTVTRYCSSSLQTTRMALHAIKAGEGDVFVSAGVETRLPVRQGQLRRPARHPQPALRRRRGPHRRRRAEQAGTAPGTTRARTASVPDVYIAMGQTAENLARAKGVSRAGHGRVRRPLAEPRREGHRGRLLGARDHPGDPARRHGRRQGRRPARRRHAGGRRGPQAGLPPRRPRHRRQLLPAQRRRRRARRHVRHQGPRARPDPAGPDRLHRRLRPVPRDHGARPGRGVAAGAGPRRDDHRRHRPGRDQRGVRRPGDPLVPASWASPWTGSTSTAARSPSATPSA